MIMFGVVWGKGKGNVNRLMLIALASAILTLLMIATPGCWSARELDKRAIVVALGIDKAKEPGKLEVSYQIIKPAEVGVPRPARGGEGQGRGLGAEHYGRFSLRCRVENEQCRGPEAFLGAPTTHPVQ